MSLNVREEIFALLESKGCRLQQQVGILYVTTPDGEVWDMTVPMCARAELKINADGRCACCDGKGAIITCHLEDPDGYGGLKPCPVCKDGRWKRAWDEYWSTRRYPSREPIIERKG
jgi:hypothetical protein